MYKIQKIKKKKRSQAVKNTVKPCLLSHGVKTESKKICHLKIFKIEFNDFWDGKFLVTRFLPHGIVNKVLR